MSETLIPREPIPRRRVEVWLEEDHAVIAHTCQNRERVTATLPNGPWRIEQFLPLTVRPSVGCNDCGLHGWITGGAFWTTGGPR